MSRQKYQKQLLIAANTYIQQHLPELDQALMIIRMLDGPPDAPHYAVMVEACCAKVCPRGFSTTAAAGSQCGVLDCPLRRSARLLLDNHGDVMHVTCSGIHWS
jgi:hypothetical protein